MMDRTVSPEIKDAIEFDVQLKPYEKFTLDNGIQVYAVDAGAQDVLQIEWIFYAGNIFENNNGIAFHNEITEFPNIQISKDEFDFLLVESPLPEPHCFLSLCRYCCMK